MPLPNMGIAAMFYAEWYKKDVSPNLTESEKKAVMQRLSDWSMKEPFWYREDVPLDDWPELKPYSHTGSLSGTQLYVVFSEIFNEVSKVKYKPPYPKFPAGW